MPHDVFVSHSAADKLIAGSICNKLESIGVRCWIAPRDMAPGADWTESILEAIAACKVLVLVFSTKANASHHVQRELASALEHRLKVIPFRVEATSPTGSVKYYLGNLHWLDAITPPIEKHLDTLAAQIKLLLSPGAQADEAEASANRDSPVSLLNPGAVGRVASENPDVGLLGAAATQPRGPDLRAPHAIRPGRRAGMFVLGGLAICAALVLTPLREWFFPPYSRNPVERAQYYLKRYDKEGYIQRAIEELERVPNTPVAQFADAEACLALAYWRRYKETGEFKARTEALNTSATALAANGEIPLGHFVKGLVEKDKGNWTAASNELFRANALEGEEEGVVLIELANVCQLLHNAGWQGEYLQKAMQVRNKSWDFYNELAKVEYHRKNWNAALTNALLAIRLAPENSLAECNAANYYISLPDSASHMKDAWDCLERARKFRANAFYHYSLGEYYRAKGNSREAAECFKKAAELKPKDYRFWGGLGLELMQKPMTRESVEYLNAAISKARNILIDTKDCLVEAHIGLYHAGLDQPEPALEALRGALAECPDNSQVREANEAAATIFEDNGHRTSAEALRSLDKRPKNQ